MLCHIVGITKFVNVISPPSKRTMTDILGIWGITPSQLGSFISQVMSARTEFGKFMTAWIPWSTVVGLRACGVGVDDSMEIGSAERR